MDYIKAKGKYPVVIKADGLALGKGVLICENEEQAADGVKEIMLDKKFGASGNHVVVEEFLTGPEVSVLSFTDGKVVKPMVSSMDHKRCLLYTSRCRRARARGRTRGCGCSHCGP